MPGDILQIGIGGMRAAQLGMAVTGHNTVNANTLGYTRQRTVQGTETSSATGVGFIGRGVHVTTITRLFSQSLTNQVTNTQGQLSQLDTYS
ncbi:MAG: flagellar hook-associated protein FlgK, partial [Pseudomonadota bacterium]